MVLSVGVLSPRTNPLAFETVRQTVTSKDNLDLNMAAGGGIAIRFRALD
jgi:alpha-glucosidase